MTSGAPPGQAASPTGQLLSAAPPVGGQGGAAGAAQAAVDLGRHHWQGRGRWSPGKPEGVPRVDCWCSRRGQGTGGPVSRARRRTICGNECRQRHHNRNADRTTQATSELTAAHNTLAGQVQQYQQPTVACSAELSCFQTADRELADAFAAFATELRRIEFPAAAQAEAAELGDLADRIAGSSRSRPPPARPRNTRGWPPTTRNSATPSTSRNKPWSARYPAKPVPRQVRAPPVLTLRRAAGSDCVAKVLAAAAPGQQTGSNRCP